MLVLEQHKRIKKLIASNTIVPGVFKEENGVKVYIPISQEQYNEIIENGNVESLAYNTYSMGRGIFTVGSNGEIVNFKGVDSRLDDSENIAVGKVNAQVYDISRLLGYNAHPYGITVMAAPNQHSEIRVRGASQLQNLINEKQKLDETKAKDKAGLIKFPKITEVRAFSEEFCRSVGLPRAEKIAESFIEKLRQADLSERERTGGMLGNYAYICLEYMRDIGMPVDVKNQTWQEYFSGLSEDDYDKIKDIPDLQAAIMKQDKKYELGATFGQTTRILENPFRIMDLAHFVDNRMLDSVQAILDYTSEQYDGDYITLYAETMGKNLAGFMNLGLAYNNWSHRQDFSLSGEMCDDAYDDVSKSIICSKSITEDDKHYKHIMKEISIYYNQIYLFASNMKVIEDAYRMLGREVSEDYQDRFIETFIENLQDRDDILRAIHSESSRNFEEILKINGGKAAIRNFEGYEEYIKQFREKFSEKVSEYFSKKQGKEKMGNYASTYNTMKRVYDEVNSADINAYMIGGISSAIQANIDLYRQNEDIDLMVDIKDLDKLIERLRKLGYRVEDKRANLTENYVDANGVFHPMDHELNADINDGNMLGVGIFLFERKDGTVITNSYAYDEREGCVIGTQKVMPEELFDLMYSSKKIDYKGTQVRCQSKEFTYLSKSNGTREKDKMDASIIEKYIGDDEQKRIDRIKILQKRIQQYRIMYDKDGNVISSEKLPSIEDKIARFISKIASSNAGVSNEEIKKIVLGNDFVKKMMEQDEDIRKIMGLWQVTEVKGDIADVARQIAHDYYYVDASTKKTCVRAQEVGKGIVTELGQTEEIDKTMQTLKEHLRNKENEQSKGENN